MRDFEKKVGLRVALGIAKFDTTVGWGIPFHFHCAHMVSNISIALEDNGTSIGKKVVPVVKILNGQEIETRIEILDQHGNLIPGGPEAIPLKLQYLDVEKDDNWDRGIRSREFSGLPHTFFSQTKGCKVSLYQDAHVPGPNAEDQPRSCWEDIFDAIKGAQHIIYITGWSVYTEISLKRGSPELERDTKLGKLLMDKAREGVQVLLLVWGGQGLPGLITRKMATHANETSKYFDKSKVHCVLCRRKPDDDEGFSKEFNTLFKTHHQKTVVVDSELPSGDSGKRGLVSFVGGIDLCDGRYDTPSHSLFRTLGTVHRDDFHQPNFSGSEIKKGGPREPWHDIHARLEGPIAWDVLDNFVQRWKKQGKNDVKLINLEAKGIDRTFQFPGDETWCVQLFRSIDSGSADFECPKNPKDVAEKGLVSGKNNIIDRSIQDAYINAIRRAKNFIYIESQYFLGSCYAWNPASVKLEETAAWNLIPKELSLKIARKIEAGERFTVYVVVPMWPEGIPEGSDVQEILFYQNLTMEMMYKDVIRALEAKGSVKDPLNYGKEALNYLAFFCLGNREKKENGESSSEGSRKLDSHYMRAQESRRFMIYVHSKMMIVDDEYIIIGSANINDRSMDGTRDTEIAFGGYQPQYLATKDAAKGQIYGFRKSLWREHLRTFEPCFDRPQDEVCIKRVNKLARENWDAYSSGSSSPKSDLPRHLLPYPVAITDDGAIAELESFVAITEDGAIAELERFGCFPDTEAPVSGKQSLLSSWHWILKDVRCRSMEEY